MSLTTEQKISIVSECDEILNAVKLLIIAFEDNELENHITLTYDVGVNTYELKLLKTNKKNVSK